MILYGKNSANKPGCASDTGEGVPFSNNFKIFHFFATDGVLQFTPAHVTKNLDD